MLLEIAAITGKSILKMPLEGSSTSHCETMTDVEDRLPYGLAAWDSAYFPAADIPAGIQARAGQWVTRLEIRGLRMTGHTTASNPMTTHSRSIDMQ